MKGSGVKRLIPEKNKLYKYDRRTGRVLYIITALKYYNFVFDSKNICKLNW